MPLENRVYLLQEDERAVLWVDLPNHGLQAGDMGTVVHLYADGRAYAIEFFTADGQTWDVVMVEATTVRPVQSDEMLHVRALVPA